MYNFIDVTERPGMAALPTEAMSYNGVFIENIIPGYRTLNVTGRESTDEEINEINDTIRDGNRYLSRRYKPRTLTVTYQLLTADAMEFRSAYDQLNYLLDPEQVQIIFNDEPDKYYVGTKRYLSDPPEGTNSVIGKIEIYCADPHKYSVQEYEIEADNDEFEVYYDGTYKSFPKFEATCASDNGFVSFIDQNDHVIQIGNEEEEDTEQHDYQETLIKDDMSDEDVLATWTSSMNVATLESDVSDYVQQGTVKAVTRGVKIDSFGSDNAKRHGPSITKAVPADSSSHVGAKNFDLSFNLRMYARSVKQGQEVMVICTGTVDNVKTVICSVHIHKGSTSNYNAVMYAYVMGQNKKSASWTAEEGNKYFGESGTVRIRKNGDTFTFMATGVSTFETKVAGTEDIEVTEISVFFDKTNSLTAMTQCAVNNITFTSYSVSKWDDVPNKFADGDVITCDCASGQIAVNDEILYGLGMITNDWEDFFLKPGLNTIKCYYSDFATAPTFKMKYRKAYL